jgi:hypothetical protein
MTRNFAIIFPASPSLSTVGNLSSSHAHILREFHPHRPPLALAVPLPALPSFFRFSPPLRCTILTMSAPGSEPGLFPPDHPAPPEPRSTFPWIIALGVVVLIIGVLVAISHHSRPANPGGASLAPPDPYAANLPISSLEMSQASSMAGSQSTYVDGQITNKGDKTVSAITVQVAFHGFANPIAQKETLPLSLIRTRQPYIDTEPVIAAPIHPGETRDFRLIFDNLSQDWNQNYPEIRVISVTTR